MPRALLSVSDKTGLAAFARGLSRLGYELFATNTTLQALQEAAVDVHPVSDLTFRKRLIDAARNYIKAHPSSPPSGEPGKGEIPTEVPVVS